MINRELVAEKYNEKQKELGFDASYIMADDDAVIEGMIDLELEDVTEKMVLECIEDGAITKFEELVDASHIKHHIENKPKPKKKSSKKKAAEVTQPPAGGGGMLENALQQILADMIPSALKSIGMDAMIDEATDKVNAYVEEKLASVPKVVEYEFPDFGTKLEDVVHECFEDVMDYAVQNDPVLLVGAAGTGKNHLCKQVADSMGLDFYFTNAVTQEHKLAGFIDANGNYHETQFYKAFTQGGVFMFDEMDASDENVMTVFNAMLANGYFDFPTGKVYAHENFRVIGAANTMGTGASAEYVGRNQLDGATLDRFGVIEIGYSEQIENAMTDDSGLLNFIRKLRQVCEECGINHIVSYRAISRLSKHKKSLGCKKSLKYGLIKNLENDDLMMMVNKFNADSDEWSVAFKELVKEC